MRRSWLKYLGFLGLLSLLGLVTSNPGFLGFLVFFIFFIYRNSVNDERFEINVGKATRNSFIASMVVFALAVTYGALVPNMRESTLAFAFVQSFALQVAVFTISIVYLDRRGTGV